MKSWVLPRLDVFGACGLFGIERWDPLKDGKNGMRHHQGSESDLGSSCNFCKLKLDIYTYKCKRGQAFSRETRGYGNHANEES